MKKYILLLLFTAISFAQAPTKNPSGFYAGSGTMNASAIGQFDSTSKGFIFPRMTETQRNAIASPATSLVIFNTTSGQYNYYNGSAWTVLGVTNNDLNTTMGFGNWTEENLQFNGGAYLRYFDGTYYGNLSSNILTVSRNWGLPDKSGTIAVDPTLQEITTNGNQTTNDVVVKSSIIDSNRVSIKMNDDLLPEIKLNYTEDGAESISTIQPGYISTQDGSGSNYLSPLWLYMDSSGSSNKTVLAPGNLILGNQASDTGVNSELTHNQLKFKKGNANKHIIDYTDPTGDRTHTLQNASGIIAHLSDIPAAVTVDATPTDGSSNAVSSNGVFDALATKADVAGSTAVDFQVPTTPAGANSATSKNYIDNLITGITWKNAVKCSTTANHSLSGTANVDGVTVPAGTRVLVRFQTAPAENGIYITASGAWTRATDCDSAEELTQSTVLVTSGTLYKNTQWTQNNTITTVGTDAVSFVQVAGAGTYTNGTGIDLTANVFSVDSSVTRNSSTQTLTNKSIDGASNTLSNIAQSSVTNLTTDLAGKQATLVSGTNIKTIESNSLLGSGNIDLTKSDVGLSNVDNTSDANKPVSTAQQTAIDAKMSKSANGSDIANVATFRQNLGVDKLTSNGNSNYTILSTDKAVVTSATLTASRTWTLPLANSVNAGYEIIVADLFGAINGSNTIVIARSGSDTINGATSQTIGAQYGMRRLISDGVSKWTFDGGVMRISDYIGTTLTASKIVATDSNSKLQPLDTATYPSLTELSYVKGVTSAIQTQLDNRVRFLWTIKTPTSAHTGTISETIIASVLIPANTLSVNDIISLTDLIVIRTVVANSTTVRLRLNSSASLSGATLLGSISMATNTRFINFQRTFSINGGNIVGINTAGAITDRAASSATPLSTAFDVTANNYLIISFEHTSSSDSGYIQCLKMTN